MISADILYVMFSLCVFAVTKLFEHMDDVTSTLQSYLDVSKERPGVESDHADTTDKLPPMHAKRPPSPRPYYAVARQPVLTRQLSAPVTSDLTYRTIPNHEALIKRLQRSNSEAKCAEKRFSVACGAWRINRKKKAVVELVHEALAAKESVLRRHPRKDRGESPYTARTGA